MYSSVCIVLYCIVLQYDTIQYIHTIHYVIKVQESTSLCEAHIHEFTVRCDINCGAKEMLEMEHITMKRLPYHIRNDHNQIP